MSLSWEAYFNIPRADEQYAACRQNCRETFDQQRKNIERVFAATAPSAVACLGAGLLNDIPYQTFLAAGATVHLVDWLPDSVDNGIKLSIIEAGEDGQPRCSYCDPAISCPERYCRHFVPPREQRAGVCEHYMPSQEEPRHCVAFERGDLPMVHYADVTAGYASSFGRAVSTNLRRVRSWKQAFEGARTLAGRVRHHRGMLNIAKDSVQMVTSSMVMSQFEHEPYGFFSQHVAAQIGPPSPEDKVQLKATMEGLRTSLLDDQIERHCEEIDRILAPGGRCYLSFEMFHCLAEKKQWIAVEGMPKMLEEIGRRFHFNFDLLGEAESLTRFEVRGGVSLVGSYVLESKKGAVHV